MIKILKLLFFLPLILSAHPSDLHLKTLYHTLDPDSIAEQFAFYSLYPKTLEGREAMENAWNLMNRHRGEKDQFKASVVLPPLDFLAILPLIIQQKGEPSHPLTNRQLTVIEKVSNHLSNRKLKGFHLWSREEILALETGEVDLARAILVDQFEDSEDKRLKIRRYEAGLDLMALQIMARLPKNATSEEKIREINRFIFHEKKFRFPPHSIWTKEIDFYTLLPSVFDSRLGVCLGVCVLYLSIGQRMNLPLEIITPPGHIYIRYKTPEKRINIETTARGISLPTKSYFGLNTRKLKKRNLKEVIGLVLVNQASTAWQREEYSKTVELYEKAHSSLENDPWLETLLSYAYLLAGKTEKGERLLEKVDRHLDDSTIYKQTTPEDYLNGLTSAEGIKAIFLHVDETRQSIVKKQQKIKEVLEKYPLFREGLFHLAISQLQLSQTNDALETLDRYHKIDPHNPEVEYYLSLCYFNRLSGFKAWNHLKNAERMTKNLKHFPDALKKLRHQLRRVYPDPEDQITLPYFRLKEGEKSEIAPSV